jgi:hypothetical protein
MTSELRNSRFNNYFMKPTIMSNGLILYPINIYDYEEFRPLAVSNIVLDMKSINNSNKQEFVKNRKLGIIPKNQGFVPSPFDNLFDYIVNNIKINEEEIKQIKSIENLSNEEKELLKLNCEKNPLIMQLLYMADNKSYRNLKGELIEIFKFVTKGTVMFAGEEFLICVDKETFTIDRDNFYEFRQIVMEQNLLHEPLVAPDEQSQKMIDREITRRTNDNESDLEAIISFVCVNSHADVSNYTYYRLMADYITILRTMNYQFTTIYRANGCKAKDDKEIEYPDITEHLSIKDNPYSQESIYKQSKLTKLEKELLGK